MGKSNNLEGSGNLKEKRDTIAVSNKAKVDTNLAKQKHDLKIPVNEIFEAGKIPAIFIYPDSIEIEALKLEMGDNFYTSADDYNFYDSQAMDFLKGRGVKYASTDKRYVRFITYNLNQKDTVLIDTDTLSWVWGLLLFDGYDPPIISSAIGIEADFEELDE